MRSLGEFVGHIAHALKTPASRNDSRELRREVETEQRDSPHGTVTLRRTTIEEVEFKQDDSP